MQKIEEILRWNFQPSHFKYAANHLFSDSSKKQIKESKDSLEKLINKLPDGSETPDRESIEHVYFLFVENYQTPSFTMSKRNTRLFIWALDYQPNTDSEKILLSSKLDTAIKLIEQNWRDSFIVSLWHVMLKNWSDLITIRKNRSLIFKTLKKKSKAYKGNRRSILSITQHINMFLDNNSSQIYASELIARKTVLSDANELFDYKERILGYDYFSSVASDYLSLSQQQADIDAIMIRGIYSFLSSHNSHKTTLLICSKIINKSIFSDNIDIVKDETIRLVGDPFTVHLWRNNQLVDSEQEKVDQARAKLKILLNKEFIEIFFKIIVEDKERERYWLRFIDDMNDIKIVGNIANYNFLKGIDSISEHVNSRYKTTNSSQSTCALIMYIKDYVFVEFSDVGALYIYKKLTFEADFNLNMIYSINDLKKWPRDYYACRTSRYMREYLDFNEEGRINHRGRWERRVDAWMNEYI